MPKPWITLYGHVPDTLPITNRTIVDLLIERARVAPTQPAIYYFDTEISWHALVDRIRKLGAGFQDMGIKPGDRVGVMLQNLPAFVVVQFALWWIGAVVVPLNVMYRTQELIHHLGDSECTAVVVLQSLADRFDAVLGATSLQSIVTVDDEEDFAGDRPAFLPEPISVTKGTHSYRDLLSSEPINTMPYQLSPSDVAYLNYTSGTTGVAKGAMTTHGNLLYNASVYGEWLHLGDGDVNVVFAPLFHITGSVSGVAASIYAGIPMALLYRFDAGIALKTIERRRATFTVGAITTYLAMMNHADISRCDLSSLTKAYSGGAPVSPATVERFRSVTGQYIYNVYGLTESTSPATMVPWRNEAPVDPESGALSVGIPVPGLDVKIVSLANRLQEQPFGTAGELALRGPQIVPGYWKRPDETAKAIQEGWFYTGDVAVMDEQGWVYIVDRVKDMIDASGYKVWPREVEDALYLHPAVAEAAVVGVPDPYRGETVKAFVALRADQQATTAEEIRLFVKERLATYKVPTSVEIVSEIPKTVSGKFLRRVLREQEIKNQTDQRPNAPAH